MVLVALASLWAVPAAAVAYEAKVSRGVFSVTADGAEVVPATAAGSAGLRGGMQFTLRSTAVTVTGAEATYAAMAAAVPAATLSGLTAASCAEVIQFLPSLFLCRYADNLPAGRFVLGSTSDGFSCEALLSAPVESLACNHSSDTSRSVSMVLTAADAGVGQAAFSLDAATAGAHETSFVALAGVKVKAGAVVSSEATAIRKANEDRRDESRLAVVFLYLFIAAAMTVLAVLCAVWQGWLYPVFPAHAEFWWFAIFFTLIHLVSWVGGLAGWICILSLVGLYILLMPVVYLCIRWQHRRLLRRAGVTEYELIRKYGEQEESETDDDDYDYDESSSQTEAATASATASASGTATETEAETETETETTNATGRGAGSATPAERLGEPRAVGFTQQPAKLGRAQGWWLLSATLAFSSAASCFQPKLVAKTIGVIYAYDTFATVMRMDWLLQAQTKACGVLFKRTLSSDSEKKKKIQDAFIDKYSIDMSIFDRPSYTQYSSVNDWFTRSLAAGARPVVGSPGDDIVASSADCRAVVYESVPENLKIWLKGEEFTAKELLHYTSASQDFAGGPIAILRLAPADYHRTHAPISGTITNQYAVKSTIYSVGADAMRSNNGAIYNTRTISIIDSGRPGRKVGFVAIGATCVGSVVMLKGTGATVTKGEDFSYFQFGGSTVVLTFPPNSIAFDADLLYNSRNGVETLITMGSRLGTWTN
ncbi:phosphatidylserine decarboxylase subunit beta [Thecamonas trahens ATCC 50062]|uniref:Phosphatidylserine decarboxylase subunit beta n=1 Tax=Thecamonas trahens ATCC 50062 TaxID=461836 RepID=A0A0L0DIH6_THETB|nr:phosphatidylserine decarboxylase subunit beta [Thecamonas trahens ATCC 50062]KNC52169.1 phosphatidylserine decarboxylase subunit beta [Thecamonas trahens ATCC 50062]|eukprot:XP_013762172.1 phosphatidylserine decarboxylase subunit beta [Thecamonas trahens ATCC 50062]